MQANLEDLANAPASSQGEGSAAKRAAARKGSIIGASGANSSDHNDHNDSKVQDLTSTPGSTDSPTTGPVTTAVTGPVASGVASGVMGRIMAGASARKSQRSGPGSANKSNGIDNEAEFDEGTGVSGTMMDVVSQPNAPLDLRSGENSTEHSGIVLYLALICCTWQSLAWSTGPVAHCLYHMIGVRLPSVYFFSFAMYCADAEQEHKNDKADPAEPIDAVEPTVEPAVEGPAAVEAALDKACILHMDSLGMHNAQSIGKWLRR